MTVRWGRGSSWSSQHDGRRDSYQGLRVPPNLLRKSVPPASASRRLRFAPAALTAAAPPVVEAASSFKRAFKRRRNMTYQPIGQAADRVVSTLISGLELEFGRGAGEALAQRFLAAEEVEFHWDARVEERWIGTFEGLPEDVLELDRIRIMGRLDGRWFVAVMIVDGDGNAHGMMGKRVFSSRAYAVRAFADA
ncbi:hypothetical protein [Sphingomonas soli]|uniref:hypothetical protein n=1 Tax=Sphingomonas soli TaxID=266127 RepID=UPI000AEBC7B5|nr:hypothetical protein [Sphingomonas soli]